MNDSAAVVNFAPDPGSVEIRSFAKPEIGDEDVLVEVAAVVVNAVVVMVAVVIVMVLTVVCCDCG